MVDLKLMNRIKLNSAPLGQKIIATTFLMPNYRLFPGVNIVIEDIDNIPKNETVIFAMNHTDRYNYWPFQYKIWRTGGYRNMTAWTKGKYFHNPLVRTVLKSFGAIPVLSKGYFIEEFYKRLFDKRITLEEYRVIRDLMEKKIQFADAYQRSTQEVRALLSGAWQKMYSSKKWQRITELKDSFVQYVEEHYDILMEKAAQMSHTALFEKKLSLIVFPEGTRAQVLGEGKTGIAQLALNTGKPVIPVGCNFSDTIYPGNSPIAKKGTIVYRIGKPMTVDGELKNFRIDGGFRLFSRDSQEKYRMQFDEVTMLIMDRILSLLDDRYKKSITGTV